MSPRDNPDRVLVLGAGQVGTAVAKLLLERGTVVHLHSRRRRSLMSALAQLDTSAQHASHGEMLLGGGVVVSLDGDAVVPARATDAGARLASLVRHTGARAVVDCMTTATALAGMTTPEIVTSGYGLMDSARSSNEAVGTAVSILQCQVAALSRLLAAGEISRYVKLSTTGLGGMGLGLPYTYGGSGDVLSPSLWMKTGLAGAHSHFLWGLARSFPGQVALIVPRALVGFEKSPHARPGEALTSGTVGAGNDRRFSADEVECFGADSQMGVITHREVAQAVIALLDGEPTPDDLLAALQRAALAPTSSGSAARDAVVRLLRTAPRRPVTTGGLGLRTSAALLRLAALRQRLRGPLAPVTDPAPLEPVDERTLASLQSDALNAGLILVAHHEQPHHAVCVCGACQSTLLSALGRIYRRAQLDGDRPDAARLRRAFSDPVWTPGNVLASVWSVPTGTADALL